MQRLLGIIISYCISLPTTCLTVGRVDHGSGNGFAQKQSPSQDSSGCPSMFVAVFSRRDAAKQRKVLRDLWVGAGALFDRASDDSAESAQALYTGAVKQGWPSLQANFAICTEDGRTPANLQEESDTYGDLLFLACEEGYSHGLLTRKTLVAMQAFRDQGYQHQLFMKVDDDTFVARGRLCNAVRDGMDDSSLEDSYMGVLTPKDFSKPALPHREKNSQFYEPEDVYPNATYPPSMEGGPGYILGRRLLKQILDSGVPEQHILWTEDKAVGVWIQVLESRGIRVNWRDIPGTDGYGRWRDSGSWGNYPYILRHHLRGKQISCLAKLDAVNDPNSAISPCFQW